MRVVPTVLINNYQAMVRRGDKWRGELEDVTAALTEHGHVLALHTAPAAPYLRFLEALGMVRATQPADSYVFRFEPTSLLATLRVDELPGPEDLDGAVRALLLDQAADLTTGADLGQGGHVADGHTVH